MSVTRPALRYHGAKFRLAGWILQFFPPHQTYTEAFGGAAGVLLQKPRAYAEVYNDLDADVANFFAVLRDPDLAGQLALLCALTPYARDEFDLAWEPAVDMLERARRTAIRAQMGFGSAGATRGKTGLRTDTLRKYSTAQMDWASYPDALATAAKRFIGVLVENRPAIDVMRQHDTPETLHFVDPPYVHSTRVLRSQGGYRHELSDDDHEELIDALQSLLGMVVLSGYASDLYDQALPGWRVHQTTARISSGLGTGLRTELAWLNPACQRALLGCAGGLFTEAAS